MWWGARPTVPASGAAGAPAGALPQARRPPLAQRDFGGRGCRPRPVHALFSMPLLTARPAGDALSFGPWRQVPAAAPPRIPDLARAPAEPPASASSIEPAVRGANLG